MNWTQLAEDTVHRLAFVLITMNLQVQQVSFFEQDNNLSVFFWVFPRHLIMVCRRFGTLCLFHRQRLDVKYG